mmetsp:Transcript_15393/g.31108  ORF Transcript_15393/g.31108 Transcript_15393/m.31108 type:complete len:312 (+) Transcript_15393:654-1589(+)
MQSLAMSANHNFLFLFIFLIALDAFAHIRKFYAFQVMAIRAWFHLLISARLLVPTSFSIQSLGIECQWASHVISEECSQRCKDQHCKCSGLSNNLALVETRRAWDNFLIVRYRAECSLYSGFCHRENVDVNPERHQPLPALSVRRHATVHHKNAQSCSNKTTGRTTKQYSDHVSHERLRQTTLAVERTIIGVEAERSACQSEEEDLSEHPDALQTECNICNDLRVSHLRHGNRGHENNQHTRGLLNVSIHAEGHHSIAQDYEDKHQISSTGTHLRVFIDSVPDEVSLLVRAPINIFGCECTNQDTHHSGEQ